MRVRLQDESQRGHGFTTLQMQHAPQGALFIWCTNDLGYAKDLARKIGREDLEIVGPSILDKRGERLRGRRFSGVVLDHSAEPDEDKGEYGLLRDLRAFLVK